MESHCSVHTPVCSRSRSAAPPAPQHFAFVLLPEFSLMALAAAMEPLRHANHVLAEERYRWSLHGSDGKPVPSSSRVMVEPEGGLEAIAPGAIVVVCAGPNVAAHASRPLLAWLRKAARHMPMIGGLCTAPRVLAEAGLLDGYRATAHWEMVHGLRERFPAIDIRESLFEFDRDRMTCAGETSCVDMMLTFLAARHGEALASAVAAQLLHVRIRAANEQQTPPQLRYRTRNPLLLRVIDLMTANLEEPLDIAGIAALVGCSRRQIERLFNNELRCSPMTFYRSLRLDRARQLVTETRMSCLDVAVACGFATPGAFSKAYRLRFGVPPHKDTASRVAALAPAGAGLSCVSL